MSKLSPDKSHIKGQPFFYGQLKTPWALNPFIQEPQTGIINEHFLFLYLKIFQRLQSLTQVYLIYETASTPLMYDPLC